MAFHPMGARSNNALLIRIDNIGDFVLWLDAAEALAAHYRAQGRRVILLANQVWSQMAVECGLFDEVIPVHERRYEQSPRYRWQIHRELRARAPEVAVRVAYTRVLQLNESLLRVSGARHRVGMAGTFDAGTAADRRVSDKWYTQLFAETMPAHSEMLHNASLVRAICEAEYRGKMANLERLFALELPRPFQEELRGRPYFVLFPGATFAGRLWPAERFAFLAHRITAETGWTGVVCGGPGEKEQAEQICAGRGLVNWTGRTTLTEFAAVLAGAELLVGNESSAVHIAAAAGTRSVCLLGGGHFGRFMPYVPEELDGRPLPVSAFERMACFGCDWKCKYPRAKTAPVPCIEEISVDRAWIAVQAALAGAQATTPALVSALISERDFVGKCNQTQELQKNYPV